MSRKSKTKCNLPRSTKEMSQEQIAEILRKKRECNARALRIVQTLCEPLVDVTWLKENLQHINQVHLEDVIVERSIIQCCGYPLCSNMLQNIPKQQYRISLANKAVYDITERKQFCSTFCLKAANYLKAQMLTSPLWFRESETIPIFKLLTADQSIKSPIENVLSSNISDMKEQEPTSSQAEIPGDGSSRNQRTVKGKNEKFATKDVIERLAPRKEIDKMMEVEAAQTKSRFVDKTLSPVEKVEGAIKEWFGVASLVHLLGEEKAKLLFDDNENVLKLIAELKNISTPIDAKFNEIRKLYSLLDLDDDDEKVELKPVPDYAALRADTEDLKVKVQSYFAGEFVIQNTARGSSDRTEENTANDLPLIDSQAQTALRRKVLCERLMKVVPDVASSCELHGSFSMSDVGDLIRTFKLSAHNITFRPGEFVLVAAIIIQMLCLKLPELRSRLRSDTTKEGFNVLLRTFDLPTSYVENFLANVMNVGRLIQQLQH